MKLKLLESENLILFLNKKKIFWKENEIARTEIKIFQTKKYFSNRKFYFWDRNVLGQNLKSTYVNT